MKRPSKSLAAACLGLLLLVDLLGLLDEGEHVAHAEDAAGEAVGVEQVEVVELLPRRREGDRPADDLLDAERGTAAGVAVELREDDAVEGEGLVERLRRRDRVLAGHGVDDEERVVRRHRVADAAHLVHQLGVDGEAAGGVDDDDVAAGASGLLDAVGRGGDRIAAALAAVHRHVDLAAERAQLLDGGGALEVGADEERLAALLLEPAGELGRVRRLARALEAGHEDDRRRLRRVGDLDGLAAEGVDQGLVDDLDDLLGRVERLRQLRADGRVLAPG